MKTEKEICAVCHGKGGWKTDKKDSLHYNWMDCPNCEGYGFVEVKAKSNKESLSFLKYAKYRSKLIKELSKLGNIVTISHEEVGKDLYVQVIPTDKETWLNFIKTVAKYSFYSETTTIRTKQAFLYDAKGYHYYWELHVDMNSIDSMEGLIDLIKYYNEQS